MERQLRRWVASLISSILFLLAPGLPAYAQVARIAVGEAGVSGGPQAVLTGAGTSSSISPLTALSPALAPRLSGLSAASAPSAFAASIPASAVSAAAAPALASFAARAAASEGIKGSFATGREAAVPAAAPAATIALQTVARQASPLSAPRGTDVSALSHAAINFDASAAHAASDYAIPSTLGMLSRRDSALSAPSEGSAYALKTAALVPAAASGSAAAPASVAEAAAVPAPSFARRTWSGITGFARDLRAMSFGDKKLEPLMGDVRKPRLWAQILLSVDALSNFGMSFLIGALLDVATLAAKHGFAAEKTHLIVLSAALIGSSLVYALIERSHALLSKIATTRAAGAYRMKLQDNLVHQPMQFHQEHPSGQLSSIIVKGVGYLTAQTTSTQISIFHLMILLVFGAGMMLFVSPALSVVTLALVPFLAWLAHHYQVRAWKLGERITDQRKELTRQTEESLAMHATVAAFGTQEFEAARHARSVDETAALGVESADLYAMYGLVAGFASAISQQLLYIAGGAAKLAGWGMTFGKVTALMLYAGLVQGGARGISSYHLLYQQAAGSANEASNYIKEVPAQGDAPGAPALPPGPGTIRFEKVNFSYPSRKAAPVLNDLDFTIEAGQTVAFVGTTGSGKSTVARLLLRQWEPSSGRITVDGRDVAGVTRKSLLGRMAVVPQTVALFSRTLRENMTYGSENVSEEKLKAAIHRAGADDFVNDKQRFPDGLETKITGGGTNLSGGERQRVGIVRALLREPSILILDEATSALDAATERKVQRRIAEMTGYDGSRPTTLVIAHHLNTIRGADQIIVLEKGRIAEKGTHAELLALNGHYANLWNKGGYAASDDETVEADNADAAPIAAAATAPAAATAAIKGPSVWARIRDFFPAAAKKTVEFLFEVKNYLRGDPEVGVFLPARRLWTLAGVALVQAAISIGSANMLSHYLNGVYQTGAHGWGLWSWAVGAAVSTAAQLLMSYSFSRRLGALRARAEASVRNALFSRLHGKDMPFFRENESKGLATRHDDDVETLIKKNLDVRISAPANLLMFGVSLGLLIHISLIAGGSVFLMLPLISVLGAFWGRRSDHIAQEYSNARKEVGRQGQEPLEMIATVKANGQEDAEAHKYRTPVGNLIKVGEKAAVIDANAHVSASAVTEFFAKNLIYIIGAFMLATGTMPIGSVVLMLAYAGFIQTGATGLSSDWLAYTSARGETSQIFGWLTEKLAKPANLPVPAGGGAIGFENVSFRYWENGTGGGIEDVNLSIRPGETVAFVGESGSGKSTILKLFQNLWKPKSGRVTLEGVPVGDLSASGFGSVVAAVAQETPLFYDTLRYNMLYGTPNATDAELAAAIKAAQAGFVNDKEAFPKGLDTMVGEGGAQLSGGQRQRVAIVRALLKRPRVLLLDEATSDLDKETEIAVKDAIAGMTYGASGAKPTTLIVAHNLTTIRDADRIVVMGQGRILEVGTHDELLARDGDYARLWHIQSQAH